MSKQQHSLNLLIATPAYGGMLHANYVHNILAYREAGLPFRLMTIGNESLITRARNGLLSWFHHHADYSHILFLDADVSLPPEYLALLIQQDADVVAAPVALKGVNEKGLKTYNFGSVVGELGFAWKVERVGTAALMLSRAAVDALVTEAVDLGRVYAPKGLSLYSEGEEIPCYDVFQVGVVDGEYLSEDFWVCRTLRKLGFEVLVLPHAKTSHFGTIAT